MDGRKRFEYATYGHVFFLKTEEKNLRFQTKTDTSGRGLSLLGNGNGKAILILPSLSELGRSPFSSATTQIHSSLLTNWAPWKIEKKSEIMGSLFFQRHFRGSRCCRIVRSLKFHLGAKSF